MSVNWRDGFKVLKNLGEIYWRVIKSTVLKRKSGKKNKLRILELNPGVLFFISFLFFYITATFTYIFI